MWCTRRVLYIGDEGSWAVCGCLAGPNGFDIMHDTIVVIQSFVQPLLTCTAGLNDQFEHSATSQARHDSTLATTSVTFSSLSVLSERT